MSSPSSSGMPWEPPSPEELHRLLPQYEISRLLGRGGMGAVYQGRQTRLQRDVAIKLLPASLANDPDGANFAARFEREARAMAKLDHPSIVSVYDFGQTIEGQLYFVMEYVDGMDIHRFLRHHGGWLSQGDALAIIAHVLDALVYAHGQGIIHRDIKPENILLSSTGQVKIADFGLAKVVSTPGQEADPALTATEVVLGTLAFIAPEVLEGRKTVDQRADLYAVGVMLYQMLTGRVPHGRFKLPSQLRRELDPRLDAIIVKATEADPEHRYPTASAIRADVDKVLSVPLPVETIPVARRVVAKKGRSRPENAQSKALVYLGVSLGCVAVVAVIAVLLTQATRSVQIPPATPPVPASPEPKSSEIVAAVTPPEIKPPAPVVTAPVLAVTPPPPPPSADSVTIVPSKPSSPASSSPSPITLPGLKVRVERYLDARRAQIDELAAKYQRAVDKKLGEAANAGDLKLATAYREEKSSLENFRKAIAQVAVDPLETVFESTDLPALSPEAPPLLRTLRSTWDVEQQKIRDAVDAQLRQSLKALETELTKAQDLANAEAVLAVRESLGPVATRDQPFENHLGMRFVPVPIIGGRTDGKTVLFSVWETRVKDYVRFANEAGRVRRKTGFPQGEDHPAAYISWEDAVAFCEWLTKVEVREGKIGPADVYRLPTDHEWSCAIGIGKDEDPEAPPMAKSLVLPGYPWGEAFPPPESAGNYNGEESSQKRITGYTDAFEFTAPVGSFRPNEFGLYDLGGNVEEWCLDRAHSQNSGPRVFRGGSWGRTSKSSLQSSSRGQPGSIDREPEVGFRVVLVPGRMAKPVTSFTASRNKPFENHVGMKFVPVPITGGPSDGKVILASIWETRVQDYDVFITDSTRDWPAPNYPQEEDHPAVNVNWEDAVAFCVWMTNEDRRSGRIGPNDSYRLPTDHEWSCAVGIGRDENAAATPGSKIGKVPGYPWGATFPPPSGAGNFFGEETKRNPYPNWKPISGYDDGYDRTAPVGRFTPSASGLFDLSGNVYEWCQDRTDPAFDVCVLRGGSWFISVNYALRSSYRVETPSERSWNFGFRTVLEIGSGSPYLTAELFENRLGMKFLPVPITGGPSQGRTILFSIWETRVQDYRAFFNDTTPTRSQPDFAQDGDHPMVNVRWKDAMAFCAWLTERERAKGKIGPGDVYRLPTDHEWSCAVGLGREEDANKSPYAKNSFTHPPDPGSIERFPWGETYPPPAMAGNYYGEETNRNPLPKYVALKGYNDGFVRTAPVGSFGANPLGLHDLGGNVSEWCLDLYDPGKVSEPRRILRGASWSFQFVPDLRSAARYDVEPEFWNPSAGFRVFLEVGGE